MWDTGLFFSEGREWLTHILEDINCFLLIELKLSLHSDKVFIKTILSGVDYLGWIHFFKPWSFKNSYKEEDVQEYKTENGEEGNSEFIFRAIGAWEWI